MILIVITDTSIDEPSHTFVKDQVNGMVTVLAMITKQMRESVKIYQQLY